MHVEVAEHLVRAASHRMAVHASRGAEKQQRTLFLRQRHRRTVAAGEAVDRRVGHDERELEFRNCPAEHREIDRSSRADVGEALSEERPIRCRRVQPRQQRLTNRLVAETAAVR